MPLFLHLSFEKACFIVKIKSAIKSCGLFPENGICRIWINLSVLCFYKELSYRKCQCNDIGMISTSFGSTLIEENSERNTVQ